MASWSRRVTSSYRAWSAFIRSRILCFVVFFAIDNYLPDVVQQPSYVKEWLKNEPRGILVHLDRVPAADSLRKMAERVMAASVPMTSSARRAARAASR